MWAARTHHPRISFWLVTALAVLIGTACNARRNESGAAKTTGGDSRSTSTADTRSATSTGSAASLSAITLPKPRLTDDSHPIPKALSKRQSTRAFSAAELSRAQQSEILWAAFGVNRPSEGNRRTAPSAHNCQDIDVYLATSAGVFKYDAPAHATVLVSPTDVRSQFGATYASAPLTLVYASTQSKILGQNKVKYGYMHSGMIGMNVYLYAAHENLPVIIRSDLPSGLARSLNLTSDQVITLVQTIGLPSGQNDASGTPFRAGSLETPRHATHPILKALLNRKSATGFASSALSDQTLGEVLWSGFGVNRTNGKRTAPTAHNFQDIDIYAAMASGVFRYNASSHALDAISNTDVRPLVDPAYATAPLTLVYVSTYSKIANAADRERYSAVHTGFIAQNVNAYSASENLAAKVYESISDEPALRIAMQLTSDQQIKLVQTVGAQP